MSASVIFLIFLGGFIGAIARDWIIQLLKKKKNRFLGTWFVNITGSFLLGLCSQIMESNHSMWLIAGTGVIGSYTTFSTFIHDAYKLWIEKKRFFLIYTFGTVVSGIIFFWAGTFI